MRQLDYNTIELKEGGHKDFAEGACLLEAVSYIAGEAWSDHPQCVDKGLAAHGRRLNDGFTDDERQLLKPLIPLLLNTAGSKELMLKRAMYLVDRHVRYIWPAFMRELPVPQTAYAEQMEAIGLITDRQSAEAARAICRTVAYAAYADAANAAADAADAAHAADAAAYAAAHAANAAADAADAAANAAAAYAAYAADPAAYKTSRSNLVERRVQVFKEACLIAE